MNYTEQLKDSFLFRGLSEEEISRLLTDKAPRSLTFKRGEIVYSSQDSNAMVGFVVSGECQVRLDHSDGGKTILNAIGEGGSFGILSVLSAEDFPTTIYASRNSHILFFTADQIDYFVNNCSQISQNLIHFLAQKISFLNKKIATFSGNRVEKRLAAFLLCEGERHSSDVFPFNRQKTAEEINAGRASVYRAIASLEEEGLIKIDDKKIHINDREGLERIAK